MDEFEIKVYPRQITFTCDYCDEGIPVINGYHEIEDPEGIEGTSRIPCPNNP